MSSTPAILRLRMDPIFLYWTDVSLKTLAGNSASKPPISSAFGARDAKSRSTSAPDTQIRQFIILGAQLIRVCVDDASAKANRKQTNGLLFCPDARERQQKLKLIGWFSGRHGEFGYRDGTARRGGAGRRQEVRGGHCV